MDERICVTGMRLPYFLVLLYPATFTGKMTAEEINKDFKPIDIREVFRAKNPRTARLIPGFIYRYLHRALVIDEINEILRLHGHKKGFEFAEAVVDLFNVTLDVVGKEHLPEGGPFIIVSNHPLGGFDGVLIMQTIGEHYNRKYKVLVNDILMNMKNMEGTFIPINKHGAQAAENVRQIDAIFRSDDHVMTFPAGLVSRKRKGVIRDPEWKKNFITKAVQYKRDVIPVHITGRCTNFFYNVANLRKFLRIKANLEMFYLPRESFRHKNGHYILTIGKPVPHQTFDKRFKPAEWAAMMRDHCYAIAKDPNRTFSVNH